MNWDALLRRLWPILKPRVVAFLAQRLRGLLPDLSEADALDLAVLVISVIEEIIPDGAVPPALLASAQAAIARQAPTA